MSNFMPSGPAPFGLLLSKFVVATVVYVGCMRDCTAGVRLVASRFRAPGEDRVRAMPATWRPVVSRIRLAAGKWTACDEGTPQGAVVSPLLANVYLHYVFDQWAEQWRRRHARGDMVITRYADDFIAGFQHRADAERFQTALSERFAKFRLELKTEKTRLIEFGRVAAESRKRRGLGRPETFDFLGFTHACGKTVAPAHPGGGALAKKRGAWAPCLFLSARQFPRGQGIHQTSREVLASRTSASQPAVQRDMGANVATDCEMAAEAPCAPSLPRNSV